jgi:hypothetical protein
MINKAVVTVASLTTMLCAPTVSRGSIAFYRDLAGFEATHEHLTVEDFEGARTGPGEYVPLTGPLTSTVPSEAFPEKALRPGFTIAAGGNASNRQLVVVGTNTTPHATRGVGVVASDGTMDISFDATTAVGMNLLASAGPGKLGHGTFRITIYGETGEIGTRVVSVNGADTFFGVSAGKEMIRRISIANVETGDSVFVDNLTFAVKGDAETLGLNDGREEIPGAPDDIGGSRWGAGGAAPLGSTTPQGLPSSVLTGAPSANGMLEVSGGDPADGAGTSMFPGAGGAITPAYNPHMPPTTIPEPATPAMVALGLAALGASKRRN